MKQDHLTAEVKADRLKNAVEKTVTHAGGLPGCVGKCPAQVLARRMSRRIRQAGEPATTPPLNERRILHDLFPQEPGPESRSKGSAGGRKAVVPQKRG